MAGKRGVAVPRSTKGTEYEPFFGRTSAERGWKNLMASAKNGFAAAFEYLTAHPARYNADRCYQLRGDLATVIVDGVPLSQWQYKITDGARLWCAVEAPNPKKNFR